MTVNDHEMKKTCFENAIFGQLVNEIIQNIFDVKTLLGFPIFLFSNTLKLCEEKYLIGPVGFQFRQILTNQIGSALKNSLQAIFQLLQETLF